MMQRTNWIGALGVVLMIGILGLGTGCAPIVSHFTKPLLKDLTDSFMKQKDPQLAEDGAPAFLLVLDGLIQGHPKSQDLLLGGAQATAAYASAFLIGKYPQRAVIQYTKAKEYAIRALSIRNKNFAEVKDKPYDEFVTCLPTFAKKDVPALFWTASCWAFWIQAMSSTESSWDAFADLPLVTTMTQRAAELDETYYYGGPHLLLGVLNGLLPQALGGKPEEAKKHFEKALEISKGKLFTVQVMYAKFYARRVYDRKLHDRLLKQVLATPADAVPELTLTNILAQRQAAELLASGADYFLDTEGEPESSSAPGP
jgi:tetratricopeptide (TPR) repeat protein